MSIKYALSDINLSGLFVLSSSFQMQNQFQFPVSRMRIKSIVHFYRFRRVSATSAVLLDFSLGARLIPTCLKITQYYDKIPFESAY